MNVTLSPSNLGNNELSKILSSTSLESRSNLLSHKISTIVCSCSSNSGNNLNKVFEKAKPGYHSVSAHSVEEILK